MGLVDIYWANGQFIPWTEGMALAERISMVQQSDLPPRVKRMRIRLLRGQLIAYYEKKFGKYTPGDR